MVDQLPLTTSWAEPTRWAAFWSKEGSAALEGASAEGLLQSGVESWRIWPQERTGGEQAMPKQMVCVSHLVKSFGIIF